MPVFKCKRCGANLNVTEGSTVATCEFCETEQTIPKLDTEKKINLFGRAGRLRSKCEFDNAEALYQSIVSEFPDDAESYWGLCLCRYGIEYVDDPLSGRKIPTCHRASFESILNDSDYKQCLRLADSVAARIYKEEAAEIDSIQKKILSVVKNEKPYDVFICYKESDENGERTGDSVLAQDIYDALTAKGLKVFFSRITLENKLGVDYEPYIFAALQSAKVMLVVVTDPAYAEAVWVKNEWGRYARISRKDGQKTIIPCYRDMDPTDLPTVLASRQAQDMGKIGAIQDLTRGVMKLCGISEGAAYSAAGAAAHSASLLKRALINLESCQWDKADESAEKILDSDPENGEAYLVKFLAAKRLKDETGITLLEKGYEEDVNYRLAIKHLPGNRKDVVEGYRKQGIYNRAKKAAEVSGNDPNGYREAEKLYREIADFSDSSERAEECAEKANSLIYERALAVYESEMNPSALESALGDFRSLGDYKDSAEKVKEVREKQLSLRYKAILDRYDKARCEDDYVWVIEQLNDLGDYGDASSKAKEVKEVLNIYKYNKAEEMLKEAEQTRRSDKAHAAVNRFESLGGFKDAKDKADAAKALEYILTNEEKEAAVQKQKEDTYRNAISLINKKEIENIESGVRILRSIEGYKDSAERIKKASEKIVHLKVQKRKDIINTRVTADGLREDVRYLEQLERNAEVEELITNTTMYITAHELIDSAKARTGKRKLAKKYYKEAAEKLAVLKKAGFKDSGELLGICNREIKSAKKDSHSKVFKVVRVVLTLAVLAFCIYAFLNYMDPKDDPKDREDSLYARSYRLACSLRGDNALNHSNYTSFILGRERDISEDLCDKTSSLYGSTFDLMIPAVALSMILITFVLRLFWEGVKEKPTIGEFLFAAAVYPLIFAVIYRIGASVYVHVKVGEFIAVGSGLQFLVYVYMIAAPAGIAAMIFFGIIARIAGLFVKD